MTPWSPNQDPWRRRHGPSSRVSPPPEPVNRPIGVAPTSQRGSKIAGHIGDELRTAQLLIPVRSTRMARVASKSDSLHSALASVSQMTPTAESNFTANGFSGATLIVVKVAVGRRAVLGPAPTAKAMPPLISPSARVGQRQACGGEDHGLDFSVCGQTKPVSARPDRSPSVARRPWRKRHHPSAAAGERAELLGWSW